MNTNFSSNMSQVVGYRFHPTDEEIIINYLQPKLQNSEIQNSIIDLVDINKVEPWDLPACAKTKSKDPVWYFFSRPEKIKKSKMSNRKTEKGYWKVTGKRRLIKAKRTKKVIGTKKTLVYYLGRPKGIRTKWVMHEYECGSDTSVGKQQQGEFVLCKLKKKADEKHEKDKTNHHIALDEMNSMTSMSSHDTGEPNQFRSFDSTNQNIPETTTISDLVCDGSDMSFDVTSLTDIFSPNGMTTNTTQEFGVSNLENPNLDKQDSISASTASDWSMHPATASANIRILGEQEKVDDVSSVDGLMASDFLIDIEDDICEMHHVWALVDSVCQQEDTGNFDP